MTTGPVIFLSYRRDKLKRSAPHAIHYLLQQKFPGVQVFLDRASIIAGAPWRERLEQALAQAIALVVLIGPDWHRAQDESGQKRIEQEDDWVRREIATALQKDIPILPVQVDGARLPAPEWVPEDIRGFLAFQAFQLSTEHLADGIDALAKALAHRLELYPAGGPRGEPPRLTPDPWSPEVGPTPFVRLRDGPGVVYVSRRLVTHRQWEAGRLDVGQIADPPVGGVSLREIEVWLERLASPEFRVGLPSVSHLDEVSSLVDGHPQGWRQWCADRKGPRRHFVWAPGFLGYLHRSAADPSVGFSVCLKRTE